VSINIAAYESLLYTARIRTSTKGERADVVQTGSDRGRIIFSSAFRRLQQKAQVFPLDPNAAVRTRLTHSLEVAHTGRYLAQEILYRLRTAAGIDFKNSWLSEHEQVFTDIVEAACLIHDIGNPPFGHFGESAIRDWFADSGRKKFRDYAHSNKIEEKTVERYLAGEFLDFLAFDGNPQGLRLITKLQGDDGTSGLNLTYALLMAYLKYNCLPDKSKLANADSRWKKPGFFSTEADIINNVVKQLGMRSESRHPLSYIMEAADDICFCMSDIEDGIEKRVVSTEEVFDKVSAAWTEQLRESPELEPKFVSDLIEKSKEHRVISPFINFRTSIINLAVAHAADAYRDGHDDIIDGRHDGLLRDNSDIAALLRVVKDFVRKTVFRSMEAESVELAGYSTICGLLDYFSALLELPSSAFKDLILGRRVEDEDYSLRLVNRLSEKSRRVYQNETAGNISIEQEWHFRAQPVCRRAGGDA